MGEGGKLDGPVVVLNLDKDNPGIALGLAAELRRGGIRAEAYMGASGMRPQMKYADRRNSPAVVIVGSDEIEKGTVTIKDLEIGAQKAKAISSNEEYREARPGQIEVPRAGMIDAVRAIVEAQR
jgi:histidyl-tRNA synthetase